MPHSRGHWASKLKGYHPDTTENIPESSTITNFSGRPYYFYLLLAAIPFVVLSFIGVVNVIDVANVVDAACALYIFLVNIGD